MLLDLLLLLFLLVTAALFLLSGHSRSLALHATSTATTVRRGEGKVDVLLRVQADDE